MWRIVRYQGAYALQQVLTGKIEATGFPTARHAEAKRREAYRDAGITATSSGGGGLEPHDAAYHLNPIGSHTYLTDKGTTSHADLDTHVGAEAPHSGHEKTANKGAASGYAELNASALVPSDQLGTSGSTGKFLKYPNEWADAPGTGDWTDMDDVPDGTTYVKTHNDFTDTDASAIAALHQSPDWTPPNIIYKDADEVFIGAGRYYKMGYRFGGQYQSPTGAYWDVSSRTAVDIDATYSAGSTSGMIGGAKVNSSWYSLFLMASAPIVLVLPYVRVDTISYGAPSTTITPAAHNDGTTAENGFIVANDAWNGYRLVKLDMEDTTYNGAVYTIADSATGTPDSITITGDITSQVAAADWLQLVPPPGVDCCYLGTIRIDGSGNLLQFKKDGWRTSYAAYQALALTGSTTGANNESAAVCPPIAEAISGTATSVGPTANNRGIIIRVYAGSSGTSQSYAHRWSRGTDTSGVAMVYNAAFSYLPLFATSIIRATASYLDSSGVEQTLSTTSLSVETWYE